MKSIVLSLLILAGLTAAAPLTEKRLARRAAGTRRSSPPYVPNSYGVEQLNITNSKNVEYSENWAGAVLIGTGYTAVTAEFTVPTPTAPGGGNTEYCASAWVGLDGDTCDSSILQTGVDFCVQGGDVSYDAWYEWYPDYAYDFSGISISAGDVMKITVTATSTSSGSAVVENVSTGRTVTHSFSGESDRLCEYNAEWIVEDFEEGDSLVPFANFGTVTFTNAVATHNGAGVGTSGATIIDIEQDSGVLTSVSASGNTVTVNMKHTNTDIHDDGGG
ncbi:aspergillopepsin, putative [Talaromyces stipitatus ATCC 10500]|uniref:Aspergillopepsin, putative n=1 Tax=Talaromyces stipitatus (strain ATCC 10500 / CBS 375.48 / QM 6759 / NRRL 1006) TaxID=441959 RepID=B8M952_TALSN|nr:aspergillopepsin, putative [Talaromyces stipitatus ATCC 10500]EED17347.1 aspergillopepsin, putative [Talaromyces stipitatus ATCC 10500]